MIESGDSVIRTLLILFDLAAAMNLNEICTRHCR